MTNAALEKQTHSVSPSAAMDVNGATHPGLERLNERIRSFVRPAGWDGFEAMAIDDAVCSAACAVVTQLATKVPQAPLPRVAPATDGGITLYWRHPAKATHLTLAVFEGGRV